MQEVGGSIPPGSTSLRELRQGKPAPLHRSEASEGCRGVARRAKPGFSRSKADVSSPSTTGECAVKYVYILESLNSLHFYVGITEDLRARLTKHNAGEVPHTSKYGPWRLRTYIAFSDERCARTFEKYLKSGSGRAFAKKHF